MNKLLCYLTPVLVVVAVVAESVSVVARAQNATPRPAAPTLVPPKTSTRATDAAGFLQRWLVLEPIRVSGQLTDSAVQAAVKTEYFPDQLTVIPRDGDTVTAGDARLAWHAVDTLKYNVNLYHFANALGKPTSNVLSGPSPSSTRPGRCPVSALPSARTPPRSGGSTAKRSSASTTTVRP